MRWRSRQGQWDLQRVRSFQRLFFNTCLVTLCAILAAANANAHGGKNGENAHPASVKLFGHIDELSYMCSSAGVKLSGSGLPAQVSKLSLGSAAAYSGLKAGDKVLHAEMDNNILNLTVDRNGKKYQAKIATDVYGLRAEFEARKIPFSFGDSAFDKDLKTLGNCEITVMLDRCATMNDTHAGVPGDLSKWIWCKEQIDNLYLATDRVLDKGFNLILFNDKFQENRGVTLWDLKQVFGRIKPEGVHKNIAAPLEAVMNDYFKRRRPDSKPLLIAVVTEGTENIGTPLQTVLIDAASKMNRPGEVVVTFLQVGDSVSGEDLFDDLDRNLVGKGAKYDIASYRTFAELRNKGLLWELITAVKDANVRKP